MDQEHSSPDEDVIVNRQLIDVMYANGSLTREARLSALRFIYPHDQWGRWSAQLLLLIGSALMLSGMVYFFAYNWAKIPSLVKLSMVASVMIGCSIGAYIKTLEALSGRVLLLGASVSVGVFMAVFGQVYQTGADAFELFMMWSIFSLGWTIISRFAAQWVLWLVITNMFLILWWDQAAHPSHALKEMIFVYLILFNGLALVGREYGLQCKRYQWLSHHWTRHLLSLVIISLSFISFVSWLFARRKSLSHDIAAGLGVCTHAACYAYYRYRSLSLGSLALVMLSASMMLVCAIFHELLASKSDLIFITFSGGFSTLVVFSAATFHLRTLMKTRGDTHV